MNFELYYQVLAASLLSVCPTPFGKGQINAVLDSGYSKISYVCEDPSGKQTSLDSPLDVDMDVDKALHEIRSNWPGPPWSRCTFTLYPDGEFKFDVAYDD